MLREPQRFGAPLLKTLEHIIVVMSVWCLVAQTGEPGQAQAVPKTRLDQQGDPLPEGAVARLGTTRWQVHQGALSFSPNGRYAIVADETTRLLDAATGNVLRVLPVPSYMALFMDDNKTVILAHERRVPWVGTDTSKIAFFNTESRKITREFAIKGTACAWSADRKHIVCEHHVQGSYLGCSVCDLERGVELCHWDMVGSYALSADGGLLAIRHSDGISIFSVAEKRPLSQWRRGNADSSHGMNPHTVAFLLDGKTVIATEGRRVLFLDATTGKLKPKGKVGPELKTDQGEAITLALSADGRYLAAAGDKGSIYLWDLETGTLVHKMSDAGNRLGVDGLTFTPDSKRLVGQLSLLSCSARVWDIISGKEISPTALPVSLFYGLAFSADGKFVATRGYYDGAFQNDVRLWDAASGKLLHCFESSVLLGFHANGKVLITSREHESALWSLSDGRLHHRLTRILPEGESGRPTNRLVWTCCCPDDDTVVAIFSDARGMVSPREHRPKWGPIWTRIGVANVRTGVVERSFRIIAADMLYGFCLSPDRRLLAAVAFANGRTQSIGSVCVWDLHRGIELFHLKLPANEYCCHLSFSADGRTVFVASYNALGNREEYTFQILEVASREPRLSFRRVQKSIAFNPCGAVASEHVVALAEGPIIYLFDPVSGKQLKRLHTNRALRCLAFALDGRRLVSAGDDANALVWDTADVTPVRTVIKLADEDLPRLCGQLSSTDAEAAFCALRQLSLSPEQTIAFLSKQLHPVLPMPTEKIQALLAQLDSARFADRERAGRDLLRLRDAAVPVLAEARKHAPSVEAKLRIEALLEKVREPNIRLSQQELGECRAVELLERIGTLEARRVLERLATGAPYATMTRQAEAAVQRLAK